MLYKRVQKAIQLTLCLSAIGTAYGQLPDAPVKQPFMTKMEAVEAGELFTANILDYTSTEAGIAKGGWIDVLPQGLVDSKPGFMAYKLGTITGEVEAMRVYDRLPIVRRHKVLRWAGIAGIQTITAFTLKTDVDNYEYKGARKVEVKWITSKRLGN
jgi:hypothetical protein